MNDLPAIYAEQLADRDEYRRIERAIDALIQRRSTMMRARAKFIENLFRSSR